jgi:hypothetical protein
VLIHRNTEEALCSWGEAGFTIKLVVYIAIIVSFIASLLMHPIDMLFELLSAPLADTNKLTNKVSDKATATTTTITARQRGHLQQLGADVGRRASVTAVNLTTSVAKQFRVNRLIAGSSTRAIPAATESAFTLAQQSGKLLQGHAEIRRLTRLKVLI